jgi:hypothetical protein
MKLESQVITKDQAKILKELGINAEAIWYWVYTKRDGMVSTQAGVCHKEWAKEIINDNEGDEFDHEMAPAYSVAELGVLLPDIFWDKQWYSISNAGGDKNGVYIEPPNSFSVHIGETTASMDSEPFDGFCHPTEAQARAVYLIHLLENRSIASEDCNKRLLEA